MNKFTKYGKFMNSLCFKGANFLSKHKFLYYFLNLTWGLIVTLIGFLVSIFMLLTFHKPYKYANTTYYFMIGKDWGGLELGLCFICEKIDNKDLKNHELGHTYQNAILGPLFIFLVWIPSMIRYQYLMHIKKDTSNYDGIWFEYNASMAGAFLGE